VRSQGILPVLRTSGLPGSRKHGQRGICTISVSVEVDVVFFRLSLHRVLAQVGIGGVLFNPIPVELEKRKEGRR
jgi:hypothetical protein